mgnify:CR=1 FL=1
MVIETCIAIKLDYKYIYYKCNYCFRLRSKIVSNELTPSGIKFKGIKKSFHIHNSYNNFSNRILDLKSNCLYSPNKTIQLIINDETLKIY